MTGTYDTRARPHITVAIAAVLWASSALASATDYALDFGMAVNAKRDDNIRLVNTDEIALSGAIATPFLGFDANGEESNIGVDASMNIGRYDDNDFDSNDITLAGNWNRRFERTAAEIEILALRNTTTTSEVRDSGRVGNKAEGHERYQVSPSWSYALTENDSIQFHGVASKDEYHGETYSDYRSWNINSDWTHTLNERLSAILRLTHSNYRSELRQLSVPVYFDINPDGAPVYIPVTTAQQESGTESLSNGGIGGVDYRFSEQHRLSVFAGTSRVTTKFLLNDFDNICSTFYTPFCDQKTKRGNSFNAQADWTWTNEKNSASLNISKSNQPSSDGYPLDSWQSDASWVHRFSERDDITTSLSWGRNRILDNNKAEFLAQRSNRDYGDAVLRYNRRLTENWRISTSIQFRYQNYTEIDYRAISNVIAMAISYHPLPSHWSR